MSGTTTVDPSPENEAYHPQVIQSKAQPFEREAREAEGVLGESLTDTDALQLVSSQLRVVGLNLRNRVAKLTDSESLAALRSSPHLAGPSPAGSAIEQFVGSYARGVGILSARGTEVAQRVCLVRAGVCQLDTAVSQLVERTAEGSLELTE